MGITWATFKVLHKLVEKNEMCYIIIFSLRQFQYHDTVLSTIEYVEPRRVTMIKYPVLVLDTV